MKEQILEVGKFKKKEKLFKDLFKKKFLKYWKKKLFYLDLEGQIDWRIEASKIIGKINGLSPSPGAFFSLNGERYKILKAEIGRGTGSAGEVVSNNLEVACGNNQSIKILEIQRQGKNPQKIGDFMLGSKIKKGSIIPNV